MASTLTSLAQQKTAAELQTMSRKSMEWLMQKIAVIRNPSGIADQIMAEKNRHTNAFMLGGLYCYYYDPKTKDDLPYYDIFPLVFPYKKTQLGFIGLNMHYLPYQPRVLLLQRLMEYANNKKMDETTKLKYSWGLINGVTRFKWAEPCIHQYLKPQIKSSLRRISPSDWATAMLLPVEQFVGANKATVWADSMGR